jgi:formiminotetrahydrofolate cyclodeaminase
MTEASPGATPSPTLADLPVRELAAALSSSAPVPGGGSAAAIAGALGASLVAMVAALTAGRPGYEAVDAEAQAIGGQAAGLRDRLLDLAERDSDAYDAVMRARRLPRESDEEKSARKRAMGESFVMAASVPLDTARTAEQVLQLAARIAPIGNPNAASDAGVAAQLASAAIRGAILNVRINLPYLPAGTELAATAPAEIARLEAAAEEVEGRAVGLVAERLG